MNGNDQAVPSSLNKGNDRPKWLWTQEDYTDIEDQPADFNAGLTSLGFIRAAIRRSALFCGAVAVVGLLIGVGVYVASPTTYQASTLLLLTTGPESVPGTAILDDQALAQSRTVAGIALRKLGLQQSVSSFIGSYTATVVSDRVLLITANAASSNDAVHQASALATAFLRFRANQLETQQKLVFGSLDQQVIQAKQHVTSISERISQLSAQPASSAQQAGLSTLRTARGQAASALTVLEQAVNNNKASTQAITASQVKGSEVVDAAAPIPPRSRLKHLLLYAAVGLIVSLALSLGIVVLRALISERLYRRDDVARALGAPVKLSVGTVRLSRWLPGRHGLAATRITNVRRIVAYLRSAAPAGSRGAAALAVVPVDDPQVAALSLVSLAVSCSQEGMHVVLVDLVAGAPAARLVGARKPGVSGVRVQDAQLAVVVPGPDDFVPVGPRRRTSAQARHAPSRELAAAWASADLCLTLATLDPSLSGEHLATWAEDAVVVVTAGRSSWTKIHSVGEMIRFADTRLVSAVVVGADKTDESLGMTQMPAAGRNAEITKEGLHADAENSFVAVDGNIDGGQSDDR